ncbi:GH1 family beta-glucosidase [Streptomyces sp. DSM 42041]|uniref:Beta-glucosidase n=1 Tax=Streptomyces hazeniae TaxID=3075538 RepID=A0ABU2NMM4_9ACTN|nr:GH1 family beta-glucosidase [Streptomyces sp. DSM 42041]MDT0378225.1 GH1 family beta-glucosidase [Streptomyces sp. DSM 42041]
MPGLLAFPAGFRWGTSTSSYQVEGAVDADGRGESIWDRFCTVPGAVENGDSGEVACDQYHRYREDIELMASLGLNAHRLSLAWPRIVPDGVGRVEQRGLDHYARVLDALLEHGIEPLVTLYHWDLPQPLQDRGGWRHRDTAERFAEFAAVCFDAFGDRVRDWVTINEPWIAGVLGHQLGLHAPGEKDLAGSARAMHHLLLGHGLAAGALRATGRPDARVGVAYSLFPHTPATDAPDDHAAAHASDGYVNRWFLDPVHGRGYPGDMREHWERVTGPMDFVADGDLDVIGSGSDFIGVNYYTRRLVAADAEEAGHAPWPWRVEPGRAEVPRTDLGWEIVPDDLTALLVRLHRDYPGVPQLITENGAVFGDEPGPDGAVHDDRRIGFLHGHLAAVHRALQCGVPVEGYYHWSLVDNFEWAMGYRPRFGLVHVDRATQRRTVKDSGHWYARAVAAGGVPPLPPPAGNAETP